jgi:DTW domain-containing protein
MPVRSVVLNTLPRCSRCRLPLRWCICEGQHDLRCPLQIDVLMHHREIHRPSSTGHLVNRVFPESRHFLWRRERQLAVDDVRVADRELWILHPHGEPAPAQMTPESVQVLLLDGAWGEASAMAKEVSSWGRSVSLPMTGESRYWLRDQQDGGRFSTIEALMFVLRAFGLGTLADQLGLQLELHVYANLRARGRKEIAAAYLQRSALMRVMPDLIARLNMRRPR